MGILESGLDQGARIEGLDREIRERVRRVVDLAAADSARRLRKEQITLCKEELEGAGLGMTGFRRESVTKPGFGRRVPAATSVVDPSVRAMRRHVRMEVGQVEERPRSPDGDGLIAVERVEPNAVSTSRVPDVGPDVQLRKVADARDRRAEPRPNRMHEERYDRQPGIAPERVDEETLGQGALDVDGIPAPMEEGELSPSLVHDVRAIRELAGCQQGVGDGLGRRGGNVPSRLAHVR